MDINDLFSTTEQDLVKHGLEKAKNAAIDAGELAETERQKLLIILLISYELCRQVMGVAFRNFGAPERKLIALLLDLMVEDILAGEIEAAPS